MYRANSNENENIWYLLRDNAEMEIVSDTKQ